MLHDSVSGSKCSSRRPLSNCRVTPAIRFSTDERSVPSRVTNSWTTARSCCGSQVRLSDAHGLRGAGKVRKRFNFLENSRHGPASWYRMCVNASLNARGLMKTDRVAIVPESSVTHWLFAGSEISESGLLSLTSSISNPDRLSRLHETALP